MRNDCRDAQHSRGLRGLAGVIDGNVWRRREIADGRGISGGVGEEGVVTVVEGNQSSLHSIFNLLREYPDLKV